jgi:hypothetical protein
MLPSLLLLGLHLGELLLLGVVEHGFDLGVAVLAQALHLGHLVFLAHRLVMVQRFHLLHAAGEDRFDLGCLVGGEIESLRHPCQLVIHAHAVTATGGSWRGLLGRGIGLREGCASGNGKYTG